MKSKLIVSMLMTCLSLSMTSPAGASAPVSLTAGFCAVAGSPRMVANLNRGWRFYKGDVEAAETVGFDDSDWESVIIPHDLAIYGPFDKEVEKQVVRINRTTKKRPPKKRAEQVLYLS